MESAWLDNMSQFNHCKLISGLDDIEDLTREIEIKALNNPAKYEQVASEVFDEKLIAKKIAKRNAMLTAKAVFQNDMYIREYWIKDPLGGLKALLIGSDIRVKGARQSLERLQQVMTDDYLSGYSADIMATGHWDKYASGDFDDEIAEAIFKIGNDQDIKGLSVESIEIAQAISKWNEVIRQDKNRFGGWVAKTVGYITRQSHDMEKIRNATKRLGGEFTRDQDMNFKSWRDFIFPLLDEKTFDGIDDAEKFLRSSWAAMASGEHFKTLDVDFSKPMPPNQSGSIAKRVSSERMFHFKDGKSWSEYNKVFGKGNLRESIDATLRTSGHSTAIMKMFGPNPNDTIQKIYKNAESMVSETMDESARRKFSKRKSEIERRWLPVLDGSANIPVNNDVAKYGRNIRNWKAMTSLGGSTLASFPDIVNMATELKSQGKGYLSGYKTAIDGMFANLPSSTTKTERQRVAASLGVYLRAMSSELTHRHSLDDGASGNMAKAMKLFYKANLQNWWTDSHRISLGLAMSRYMADDVNIKFSGLQDETRELFEMYNIDSDVWDMIRKSELDKIDGDPDGEKFFTAEMARNISIEDASAYLKKQGKKPTSTAISALRKDIEIQFKEMFLDRIQFGVLEQGAKTKSLSTLAGRPGTFWGEIARFAMQFKTYPTSIIYGPISRKVWSKADVGDSFSQALLKLTKEGKGETMALAHMIAITTGLGYMSMAVKDVFKGREPRSVMDEDGNVDLRTLQAAFVQGGGAGIYGDYLFNEYNSNFESLLKSATGPVIGSVGMAANDVFSVLSSEDSDEAAQKAAEGAFRNAINNTPFINLFYTRLVLDHLILYRMKEWIDPGALDDMERNLENRTGQEYFEFAKPTNVE